MGVQLVTGYGGKPHITPKQTALFNAGIITDEDYVLNTGNILEAKILSANELSIGTGDVIMQGRHITCPDPTTISIPSGTTGYNRNDLIVLRYEKDPDTRIETVNWVVLSGVPTEDKALDPTYIHQDILEENNISNDLPVYRVEINGMVPKEPELLLPVLRNLESVIKELASYGTIVSHIGLKAYPVGAVYISYEPTSPAELFGGTWTPITGVFPYFNSGTETGGSNTHTLSKSEMPMHAHSISGLAYNDNSSSTTGHGSYWGKVSSTKFGTDNTGGGMPHNNMPSYQSLYAWRRTA